MLRAVIASLAVLVLSLWLGAANSAAITSSAEQATTAPMRSQLLSGAEDWGQPPRSDYAEAQLPDPPPYAGWRRAFSAGGDFNVLGVSDGLILISPGAGVLAYDLVTGELRWRYMLEKDSFTIGCRIYGGRAFIGCAGPDLLALNLVDGSLLWRSENCNLLAVGVSGVWLEHPKPDGSFDTLDNVVLLDAATGERRQSFETGGCKEPYWLESVSSGFYAIKRDGAVRVLLPDGSESTLPSPRPGWAAEFAYGEDWLLAGEYVDMDTLNFKTEHEYEDQLQQQLLDPATGQPGAAFILSCYSIPSGELRWRREFDSTQEGWFYPSGLACLGGTIYAKDVSGVTATVSLADGKDVPNALGAMGELKPESYSLDGARLYYLAPQDGAPADEWEFNYPLRMLDLATGEKQEVFAAQRCPFPSGLTAADGYLVGYAAAGGGEGYASTPMLEAIALGPDGLPQPGQMQLLTQREEHTQLVEAFMSSPEPLTDTALMGNIVTTGINAIERCAAGLKPEDTAHWDGLMAATLYLEQRRDPENYGLGKPVKLLLGVLQTQSQPAFTPQVVRWFHDPSLALIHNELAGLLAQCGGPAARTELEAYYAQLGVARHSAINPAPLVRQPVVDANEPLTRYNQLYYEAGLWAEASGTEGVKYALFPAAGLLSDRDLYLAVDAQADGVWDEVLPTGLRDVCFYHCHPGGPCGPGPKGQLEFSVADGVVQITHHQPVIEAVTYGEGEDQWTRKEMTGANRVVSAIKLNDLRRDTDGDGLADVLEQRLFLDPAQADTDGDGLPDAEDSAPLANPAQMGKLERGIARALKYFVTDQAEQAWWSGPMERTGYESHDAGQTWSARYLLLHGCGPVSYSGNAATYGICLATKEQRDSYSAALQYYPAMSAIDVGWATPGMDPAQAWQASVHSDSQPPPVAGERSFWLDENDRLFRNEKAAALIISVDYWLAGYVIYMIELDGEYYPYKVFNTWVS